MAHLRTQIRGALETQLQGLTTSQNRVYVQRPYNVQRTKLPALFIYTGDENIEYTTKNDPRTQLRDLTMYVDCVAEGVTTVEDTVDLMVEEIEAALYGFNANGLARVVEIVRIEQIRKSGEGEKPIAGVTVEIIVRYITTSNSAGSAA